MYLLGMFVAQQFTGADLDDLDFFAFPGDRPHDRHGRRRGTHRRLHGQRQGLNPQSTALMRYLGIGGGAADLSQVATPSNIAANKTADTSSYNRAAEEGGRAHRLGQEHLAVPGPRQPARLRQPGGACPPSSSSSRTATSTRSPANLEAQAKTIYTS